VDGPTGLARQPAPVTWGLVGLLLAVHALTAVAGVEAGLATPWEAWVGPRPDRLLITAGARYAPLVAAEPWRLVSSAALHIDLWHLASNVVGLVVQGELGERRVGATRWVAWAVVGAVAGGLGATAAGVVRSCGASGAGSAWLAALWWLAWRAPDERPRARALGAVLAAHLGLSLVVPQVDVAAHAAGAAAGLAVAAWGWSRGAAAVVGVGALAIGRGLWGALVVVFAPS
jgi:membrane associated rhomboid family serine protease